MASLAITNAEVFANLGLVIGVSRDPDDWPADVQSDVERIIRAGRRKVFASYNWSFLEQDTSILTEAPAEYTGTCVDGVVTLASGSWPSDPLSYRLVPSDDGGLYEISSTTGSPITSVTLVDTSVDFDEQEFTLYRFRYPLPSNFVQFLDPVVVENWSEEACQLREYGTLPEFQIRGALNRTYLAVGTPEGFAIDQVVTEETGGFSAYLQVYPFSDAVYALKLRLRIQPGDTLALDDDVEVFPSTFSELMQASILATAEQMYNRAEGVWSQQFLELLPLFIRRDRQMRGTRTMLPRETPPRTDRDYIRRAEINVTGAITDE